MVCGDQAEIVCTECNAVIRRVPSTELRQTLTEMELSLGISTAICPNCGAVKMALFSNLLAFTCEQCGSVTKLANEPMINRLFG
jgi:ribosomal protein S27AE